MPTSRATARSVTASSVPSRSMMREGARDDVLCEASSLTTGVALPFCLFGALSLPTRTSCCRPDFSRIPTLQLLAHLVILTIVSQRSLAQGGPMPATTSLTSNQPTSSSRAVRLATQWPQGHPRRKQILLVLCLSLLAGVIDNTVLNTALPTLARVLHAGTSSLQWIVDSYTLCFAALLIPAGALGDRYGRRLSLVGGLGVYALGSLAAAFAPNAGVLIADRVVMGLGAAFVMPATLSILNAVFPPRERPQAIAAWSAVAGVGVIIGPTLGGLLLSHFSWGSVFLVNIPIVVIALAGVFWVVPETAEPGKRSLDVIGTLLIGGALVAIVDAIIEAPSRGWTGTGTLAESGRRILSPSPCSSGGSCGSSTPSSICASSPPGRSWLPPAR